MGVYIYTLRAKTVKVELNGQPVLVNLFLYLCKARSLETPLLAEPWEVRRVNLRRAGLTRASRVTPASGLVLLGYDEETKKVTHGADVFDLTRTGTYSWTDCNAFPGRRVGWVHVEGKRLVVKPFSPWTTWNTREGKIDQRQALDEDGKITVQERVAAEDAVAHGTMYR